MSEPYTNWTKARLRAELRARSLPDRGATQKLRGRLRRDDQERQPDREGGSTREDPEAEADQDEQDQEAEADQGEERLGDLAAEAAHRVEAHPDRGVEGRSGPLAGVPAQRLLEEFRAVTGREADTIASLRADADGWHATIDVVGYERIPSSADLVLSYDVSFDAQGRLLACARIGSYVRGRPRPGMGSE